MKKIFVVLALLFFKSGSYALEDIGNKQLTFTCTGVITIDQIDTNGQRFFKETQVFDDYQLSFQDGKPLELSLINSNANYSRFTLFLSPDGMKMRGGRVNISNLKANNSLLSFSTIEPIDLSSDSDSRKINLLKSNFKISLATGNMSGRWSIDVRDPQNPSPPVNPSLTAKCSGTKLIQRQLQLITKFKQKSNSGNNLEQVNDAIKELATDPSLIKYGDIVFKKDKFNFKGKRFWIYKDNKYESKYESIRIKPIAPPQGENFRIDFAKDSNVKLFNVLGVNCISKDLKNHKCRYLHSKGSKKIKYESIMVVTKKKWDGVKQKNITLENYLIGAWDINDNFGKFYGMYDRIKKDFILKQITAYKETDQFLINKLDKKTAKKFINLAIKADKKSEKYFLQANEMLNIARGFDGKTKAKIITKNDNFLKKRNINDDGPRELFKKLRNLK